MSFEVMVDGERIIVPGGAVNRVIDDLLKGQIGIEEARRNLAQERLDKEHPSDIGYFDFDHLTPDGKPTTVGEFYEKTIAGRKLSGEWETILERLRSYQAGTDNC